MTHATEILIDLLVLVALWTVQTSILRAVMGLALTSVVVTLIVFQWERPKFLGNHSSPSWLGTSVWSGSLRP